jgi:hypothetical protein
VPKHAADCVSVVFTIQSKLGWFDKLNSAPCRVSTILQLPLGFKGLILSFWCVVCEDTEEFKYLGTNMNYNQEEIKSRLKSVNA